MWSYENDDGALMMNDTGDFVGKLRCLYFHSTIPYSFSGSGIIDIPFFNECEREEMSNSGDTVQWSDRTTLRALKNPSKGGYSIKLENPEVTFLGAERQPDFATVLIEFCPGEKIIELKSLKFYFFQFRDKLLSYERLINVVFDDLMDVYAPKYLRVTIKCRPRGGISSKLVADSRSR